ncbi:hypothetical protein [Shinella fusca]|uniref:ANTAR domain-containing protein n=1 Tax=Shinella fusca TaxID=544480 RepID=A0A7W7YXQ3_9HYPH|nr:hypothetical protein [Shinella fusca]MBB5044115.1 hypothetical protein [Shinella fusca]
MQQPCSDEATEILALHGGDALEALRTLIAERDAVEERLAIAAIAMGLGGPHPRPACGR